MKSKGFTLIELMIVAAIIAIIGHLVLTNLENWGITDRPGHPSSSAKVVDQVATPVYMLKCVNGMLFKVSPQGDTSPATDSDNKQQKC